MLRDQHYKKGVYGYASKNAPIFYILSQFKMINVHTMHLEDNSKLIITPMNVSYPEEELENKELVNLIQRLGSENSLEISS